MVNDKNLKNEFYKSDLVIEAIKKEGINDKEWRYLLAQSPKKFVEKVDLFLKQENRFFGGELFLKLIYKYITSADTGFVEQANLVKDAVMYRARLYAEEDAAKRYEDESEIQFQGYNKEESFVSPEPNDNRCTSRGIKCLYASEKVLTSILEVRPKVNDYISVAKIRVLETLNLVTLGAVKKSAAYEVNDEKAKWINDFMLSLSTLLFSPIDREEKDAYLLCQYACQFIKALGFDGIVYHSASSNLGNLNYAIFEYNKCDVVSSKIYKVWNVTVDRYCINGYED